MSSEKQMKTQVRTVFESAAAKMQGIGQAAGVEAKGYLVQAEAKVAKARKSMATGAAHMRAMAVSEAKGVVAEAQGNYAKARKAMKTGVGAVTKAVGKKMKGVTATLRRTAARGKRRALVAKAATRHKAASSKRGIARPAAHKKALKLARKAKTG
jgi:hypothetical protein